MAMTKQEVYGELKKEVDHILEIENDLLHTTDRILFLLDWNCDDLVKARTLLTGFSYDLIVKVLGLEYYCDEEGS